MMKSKLILLLVLILLFAGFFGVKFFILDKTNDIGKIKVVSSPDTQVFINSIASGKTPYEASLKVGEYLIKLIPEGTATQTASWEGKVNIYKDALTYLNRELGPTDLSSAGEIFTVTPMEKKPQNSNYGEIYVETDPAGAIVYLDNDEKGIAPLILTDVVKGDHEISVFMPSFLRRTQKINVEGKYRVNTQFKLAIDEAAAARLKEQDTSQKPEASSSATTQKAVVLIGDTPTGFLRVRSEPSINGDELAQVKPGESYNFIDEQDGWYKIQVDKNTQGWVSSQYATKQEK